jgi:hypothetical protein
LNIVARHGRYELDAGNHLTFLKKVDGEMVRHGTTNEEVVELLLDRVTEAYKTLPCRESVRALYLLRELLTTFRLRTARRVAAMVEGTRQPRDETFNPADASVGSATPIGVDEIDYALVHVLAAAA